MSGRQTLMKEDGRVVETVAGVSAKKMRELVGPGWVFAFWNHGEHEEAAHFFLDDTDTGWCSTAIGVLNYVSWGPRKNQTPPTKEIADRWLKLRSFA